MCRVFNISISSYYDWIKAGQPTANAKDSVLLAHSRQVQRELTGDYSVRYGVCTVIEKCLSYANKNTPPIVRSSLSGEGVGEEF